jgi:hypothetical protein
MLICSQCIARRYKSGIMSSDEGNVLEWRLAMSQLHKLIGYPVRSSTEFGISITQLLGCSKRNQNCPSKKQNPWYHNVLSRKLCVKIEVVAGCPNSLNMSDRGRSRFRLCCLKGYYETIKLPLCAKNKGAIVAVPFAAALVAANQSVAISQPIQAKSISITRPNIARIREHISFLKY